MNKKQGCLLAGCLISSAIVIAVIIIISAVGYTSYNKLKSFTSPVPMEIAVYNPSADEQQSANEKLARLREAIEQNKYVKVSFDQNDINTLIASHEKARELAGNFNVEIQGDVVKATGSIPLKKLNSPIFRDRFINGTFSLKALLENGNLQLHPVNIEVNGNPAPAEFMSKLQQQNIAREINNDPRKAKMLKKLKSLKIEGGNIIIETNGEKMDLNTEE